MPRGARCPDCGHRLNSKAHETRCNTTELETAVDETAVVPTLFDNLADDYLLPTRYRNR